MAYDDKFPTRSGEAIGPANEGEMLSAVGGTESIRTQQRTTDENLVTTLKTQGGSPPKFWNERAEEDEEVSSLYMDSGAVDLLSVNPDDPRSALAAPLYYASQQQAAYAAQKLLGKITPPSTTNLTLPVDGAAGESFTPVVGGDLLGKKDCAAKCPPSMFTGKARLYAQAHLGGKLKDWKWRLDQPLGSPPQWKHDNNFVLDINTGIYTDDKNAHWLVQLRGDGVIVTKLVPSSSAKALVPLLATASTQLERDKIEGYILAHSTPSTTEVFATAIDGLPPPYMLGYGWKFNWGGDKADIIKHVEGTPYHTSTHYRMTISRNTGSGFSSEANRWTFSLSVVEGPVSWHNVRFSDVISAPDWTMGNALYIFGTLYGGHSGDAPVYCFYRENDDLEVIRYYGSGGEAKAMWSGVSEPASWTWVFDWTEDSAANGYAIEGGTLGAGGGYGERRSRTHNPVFSGFSSQTGPSCVQDAVSYAYTSHYIASKSYNGNDSGNIGGNIGYPAYAEEGTVTSSGFAVQLVASDGVPVYTSGTSYEARTGAFIGDAIGSIEPYIFGYDCAREKRTGAYTETTFSLLIVPFYDAECVYMYADKHTDDRSEGIGGAVSGEHNGSVFYHWADHVFIVEGSSPTAYWYYRNHYYKGGGIAFQPGLPEGSLEPKVETRQIPVTRAVITRSGSFDFTPPVSLNQFFAGVEFVSQTFDTRSAIHGPMYGFGAQNTDGITHYFDNPPPFIGWA